MKTLLAIFLLACSATTTASAQTPVIRDLRAIIADAPNSFASLRSGAPQKDTAAGITYYETSLSAAGAECYMATINATGKSVYAIRYNIKDMQTMMLPIVTKIVEQYIAELNDMVKSGKYTGRDYTNEQGLSVTEINDKAGHHILDYSSNADEQNIYVYSYSKS